MAHKRMVLVISFEGIDTWVDTISNAFVKTLFTKQGTAKEVWRFEDEEVEQIMKIINKEFHEALSRGCRGE